MTTNLELKTIYDLLGLTFYIPYYQRGYRWTANQVKQLLEDVWEFVIKKKDENEFYCLQPVVVKKKDNESWELIDGQQRLTTIFLVLKFIEIKHLKSDFKEAYHKEIFNLKFEARANSENFLVNVENCEKNKNENIIYYHICNAHQIIQNWFKDKKFDFNNYNKFLLSFLAKEDKDNPVKVIWYEVEQEADSVDIFTRLNIGKIPLTNAELIKALFLHNVDKESRIPTPKQLQMASEWDEIEYTLQKDEFWLFITNNDNKYSRKYDTRIEYIFDLMKERPNEAEDYFTFYKFYEELQKNDSEAVWRQIKRYFNTFKEWYEDNEFYHLIGYLIAVDKKIASIKKEYDKKTKSEFRDFLKKEIKNTIKNNKKENNINEDNIIEDIKEIKYGDSNGRNILLLFNILILLKNKGASIRFPFDRYKKEKWDIEHVFSQTDVDLKGNDLKNYVKLILEFWSGKKIEKDKLEETDINNLKENIEDNYNEIFEYLVNIYKEKNNAKKLFDSIKNKLIDVFQESNIKDRDNISNLVLLDSATNRAYKNAFFPIKRMIILEKIKNGSFIPIGTQNVFLKAYSKKFDNIMYWTQEDANCYLNAIIETINDFFNQQGDNHEQ